MPDAITLVAYNDTLYITNTATGDRIDIVFHASQTVTQLVRLLRQRVPVDYEPKFRCPQCRISGSLRDMKIHMEIKHTE